MYLTPHFSNLQTITLTVGPVQLDTRGVPISIVGALSMFIYSVGDYMMPQVDRGLVM